VTACWRCGWSRRQRLRAVLVRIVVGLTMRSGAAWPAQPHTLWAAALGSPGPARAACLLMLSASAAGEGAEVKIRPLLPACFSSLDLPAAYVSTPPTCRRERGGEGPAGRAQRHQHPRGPGCALNSFEGCQGTDDVALLLPVLCRLHLCVHLCGSHSRPCCCSVPLFCRQCGAYGCGGGGAGAAGKSGSAAPASLLALMHADVRAVCR